MNFYKKNNKKILCLLLFTYLAAIYSVDIYLFLKNLIIDEWVEIIGVVAIAIIMAFSFIKLCEELKNWIKERIEKKNIYDQINLEIQFLKSAKTSIELKRQELLDDINNISKANSFLGLNQFSFVIRKTIFRWNQLSNFYHLVFEYFGQKERELIAFKNQLELLEYIDKVEVSMNGKTRLNSSHLSAVKHQIQYNLKHNYFSKLYDTIFEIGHPEGLNYAKNILKELKFIEDQIILIHHYDASRNSGEPPDSSEIALDKLQEMLNELELPIHEWSAEDLV